MELKTTLQENRDYREPAAKLAELQGQLSVKETEATRINAQIAALLAEQEKRDPLTLEAANLLSPGGAKDVVRKQDLLQKLADVQHQKVVLVRAVELQRAIVENARLRASEEICKALKPRHRELVRELAQSLVALGLVLVKERNFRESLFLADIAFSGHLRAMNVSEVGDPRNQHSAIARWLREAQEFKFIGDSDIPEEWRNAWASGFDLS